VYFVTRKLSVSLCVFSWNLQADEAFAKGIYKNPHWGIPYGLKDLFAVKH
jgi:Asp-tRNA(Asn)/Glu-tRNA(Gln) amidotransferase A subunit family amidase